MTAKRFTITQDFEEHHRQIRDNGKIIMGCFLEPQAEPIVKFLNELHEENEQLKSSDTITDLETKIMTLKTIINQLRTDNTKQKKKLNTTMKENEQLKIALKDKENLISICEKKFKELGYIITCDDDGYTVEKI